MLSNMKIMWQSKNRSPAYHSIQGNDAENGECRTENIEPCHTPGFSRIALITIISLMQILAFGSVSFVAYSFGRTYASTTKDISSGKANTIDSTSFRRQTMGFTYNRTYAERPSPSTDAAWESIFPPHGGFFNDPIIAPTGASLAVYHQLHCVDGIRHAYYTLFDAVITGNNVTFSELEDYSTDWHTRHCLDFLRQMLMCNADLTVETVDPKLGGIRGFGKGREHECVVWEDVVDWSVAHQGQ